MDTQETAKAINPVPEAVLAIIHQHLATCTPPVDPAGHLATYSTDALIPIGTAVTFLSGVDPTAYADHWHQSLADASGLHLGAAFTFVSVLDWQADASGGRLAAIVSDDRGQPWTTVWLIDGDSRIRAVCLHEGPLPSRERLQAQAGGVMAQWGANAAGSLRCLSPLAIDHHFRTHRDSLPLVSLPEARFTCQDRGDCCHLQRWDIPIAVNTGTALSAVPWKDLHTTPVTIEAAAKGYWRLAAGDDGDCLAHTDTSCSIHRTLDWQPIAICRVYPLHFTATPDAIVVTASFTCLTVGENQGAPLLERTADVQARLRLGRAGLETIPDPVRLWAGGPPVSWRVYKEVEACLLDVLADRRRGDLAARVLAGSRGMATLMDTSQRQGCCPDDPVSIIRAGLDAPRRGTPMAADMLMGRLLRDRPWQPASLRPFGGWLRSHWQLSRTGTLGEARDDELATRYVRTVLFRKPGLAKGGLAFAWGMTAWLACLWDRQTFYQHRRDGVAIDRALQLDTARRLDHLLLNADITDLLATDDALRQMITNPTLWLSLSTVSG